MRLLLFRFIFEKPFVKSSFLSDQFLRSFLMLLPAATAILVALCCVDPNCTLLVVVVVALVDFLAILNLAVDPLLGLACLC